MKIDLVIPYVNNKDPKWQKSFIQYMSSHNPKVVASMHGERFEDIGLIDYQLKLVEKNMPFINNIYLLLSNKEQAPKYLPKNCKIVLHEQFIPLKYLPTFNSTTIEMFIWDIKGLEEHFIYANDDMLPIRLLKESDFFTEKHIKMNFYTTYLDRNSGIFRHQCYNSYQNVLKALSQLTMKNMFVYPEHSMTPMIKSHCKECFELIKFDILPKIRAWRTEEQHNQYIYPNYERLQYSSYGSPIVFHYTQCEEPINDFRQKLDTAQILCVNLTKNKENVKILKEFLDNLCK